MTFSKLILPGALLVAAALSTGCESDDERKLAQGQSCLDRATTTADANACLTIVQGLESESAYLIRCSANFIAQGFTASRMATAFQQVKENTGGADPMVTLMGYFVFQSVANHTADETVTNCTRSNVRSMLRLATAAQLATTFATFTSVTNFDPNASSATITANMQAAIAAADTDAEKQQIGAVAITAASAYCNEGSSYKGTEVCTNLEAAIAGANGDTLTIGNQLITALGSNSGS